MLTNTSDRAFISTIIILFILALGTVYIVLSVKQGSQPASVETPLNISYTQRIDGAAAPTPGFTMPEGYGLTPTVMTPDDLLAVRSAVLEELTTQRQSVDWQTELAYVAEQASARTDDTYLTVLAIANDYSDTTLPSGQTLRERIREQEARMTEQLFSETMPEFSEFVTALAIEQDVARPYQLDPSVRESVPDRMDEPGYPSVPVAEVWLAAEILSDLDPDNAESYEAAATAAGTPFITEGFNYRPDLAAARSVAQAYAEVLTERPEYQTLYRAAAAEW